MLKKTIKYVDYDNNEREEYFYFNLNKAELTEMESSINGGLSTMLKKMVQERDVSELVKILKEIIMKSYGEKSNDGKHFRKSEELSKAFTETEAYVEIFMEIASSPESAINFINGILPADVREQISKNQEATKVENVEN